MYKKFREKKYKCLYLPTELITMIQARADEERFSSFNRVVCEVLVKEFLQPDQTIEHFTN